jgi:hypothetical protein
MRLWALPVVALVLGSASACSDQGEGERCDQQNGSNPSNDCAAGLICISVPASVKAPPGSSICCPPSATNATVEACRGQVPILTDGGAADAQTSTPDAKSDASKADGAH